VKVSSMTSTSGSKHLWGNKKRQKRLCLSGVKVMEETITPRYGIGGFNNPLNPDRRVTQCGFSPNQTQSREAF